MVEIPKRPRLRLHKQICRILAIMQILHAKADMTATEVHAELRSSCCKKTIVRDLETLVDMGYAERVMGAHKVNGYMNVTVFRYRLLLFKLSEEAGKLPERIRKREL